MDGVGLISRPHNNMEYGFDDQHFIDYIGPTCTVYKDVIFWKARVAHEWKRGLTKGHAISRALNHYEFMQLTEYEVMSVHEARRTYVP